MPAHAALSLPPEVAEILKYYVYVLRDPRDKQVFYVGKGTGQRIYSHVNHVLAGMRDSGLDQPKTQRITDIRDSGQAIEHLFIRTGIEDEAAAFIVEQAVIDAFRATGLELANLQGGHHAASFGLSTPADQIALHAAAPAPPLPPNSVVLMINRGWNAGDSERAIYEHTHGHWVIAARNRDRAEYAFGVARGVIRGAYRIQGWYQDPTNSRRWGFNGHAEPDLADYIGKHIREIVGDSGMGAQNPVRLFL